MMALSFDSLKTQDLQEILFRKIALVQEVLPALLVQENLGGDDPDPVLPGVWFAGFCPDVVFMQGMQFTEPSSMKVTLAAPCALSDSELGRSGFVPFPSRNKESRRTAAVKVKLIFLDFLR
jgi:hypothetical protein